jgi:HlyD family secretion protein
MKQRIRILVPILVVAITGIAFWYYRSDTTSAAVNAEGLVSGSGTIEAEQVVITAEISGRIKQLLVDEGDEVVTDSLLLEIDTALLEAQLEQAHAALQQAEANLALLKAGASDEELAQAQAMVAQAQANRDGAASALTNAQSGVQVSVAETQAASARIVWQAAQALANDPQDIKVQIDAAQASLDAAKRRLEQLQAGSRPEDIEQARVAVTVAQTNYWAANLEYEEISTNSRASDRVKEAARLKLEAAQLAIASAQAVFDKLMAGPTAEELNAAQTAVESAERTLATLQTLQSDPKSLKLQVANTQANYQTASAAVETAKQNQQAQIDAAQAQLAAAEAQLAQAQAKLEQVKTGARNEQIQMAEAQVAQAKANVRQLEVQLSKARLSAPRDGLVVNRLVQEGEMAVAGASLLTIADLNNVKLTVYVPENLVGRIKVGQTVKVSIDTFPGREFIGTINYISPEAEFTPRNVQTKEERVNTVFAVRVLLPNADHALKPGLPADAVFVEESGHAQ